MDKMKVEAILKWSVPTNLKQLKGFLGLSGYYRWFIHKYATMAAPLTELLKKDSFMWSIIAQEAFTKLKSAVASALVLKFPDFSQIFIL